MHDRDGSAEPIVARPDRTRGRRPARTLRLRLVALGALAALLLVGLAAGPAAATTSPAASITVAGVAADSLGHALGGWTVEFVPSDFDFEDAITTTTDGSGHYSVSLPAGSWNPAVVAPGPLLPTSTTAAVAGLDLSLSSSISTYDLTFPVVATTVSVVDPHGNPVAGATVSSAAIALTGLSHDVVPGDSLNQGLQASTSAVTDATGSATLDLLNTSGTAILTVTPPAGSGLAPKGALASLAAASTTDVSLLPAYAVTGTAKTSEGTPLSGWTVSFGVGATGPVDSTVVTGADGSYAASVPSDDTHVAITSPAGDTSVQSDGLALTGDQTLDLTEPVAEIDALVQDGSAHPLADVAVLQSTSIGGFGTTLPGTAQPAIPIGTPTDGVGTDPLFSGATDTTGIQNAGQEAVTDAAGHAQLRLLKVDEEVGVSASPNTTLGLQSDTVEVTPSSDQSITLTLVPIPTVIPSATSVIPVPHGTTVAQVPVALSTPSNATVTAYWHTVASAGTAPAADYAAASGSVVFAAGQTSATIPITIKGNSTGSVEDVVVSVNSPINARMGGYWGLGFVQIQPLPTVEPGTATVTAPTSGTRELDVPVTLSQASTQTVTVAWTTLVVAGATGTQAPAVDYTAASGTLTFAPGQTSATVPILVNADSTGVPEYVVVSFGPATDAYVGGFWGLGFGVIDPSP